MTTLSSREVSLSDHVKRRRSSAALSNYGGGNNSSSSSSSSTSIARVSAQHHPTNPEQRPSSQYNEGGYDSHAASYGNYDAPSAQGYGASDHGCYAAESYIGGVGGRYSERSCAVKPRPRRGSSSDPLIDLEGQRSEDEFDMSNNGLRTQRQRRRPSRGRNDDGMMNASAALRMSQASTVPTGPIPPSNVPQEYSSWEEESVYSYGHSQGSRSTSSSYCPSDSQDPRSTSQPSYCPSVATASTASSSGSSSSGNSRGGSSIMEEDAIRQGILDISTLIATYLAGGLSFVIGIFLALVSPFVKIIKLIVGDVRGLLGDVGFLQDFGSLWTMYREMRRRGGRSGGSAAGGYHPHDGRHHHHHYNHSNRYDDESTEANGTVYTEQSPQFVGGWRPVVCPSVGSSAGASGVSANSASTGGNSSWASSSRNSARRPVSSSLVQSYSSLPLVHEDQYQDHHRQGLAPPPVSKNDASSSRPLEMMYQRTNNSSSYQSNPSYYNGSSHQHQGTHTRHSRIVTPPIPQGSQYDPSYPPASSPTTQHRPIVTSAAANNCRSPQKRRGVIPRSGSGVIN